MEVPDIIGFLVSLIAVLFLIGRNIWKQKRLPEHEGQQREVLKDFLKSLEVDMDALEKEEREERAQPAPSPPPPPVERPKPHRKLQDDFQFQTKVEQRHLQTAVEERKLQTAIEKRKTDFGADLVSLDLRRRTDAYLQKAITAESRAQQLISRLGSKKEMVILQEILNPPRSLRAYRDRF